MELEHNHMTTVATEVGNHTQQVTGSLLWMYNSHNVTSTYFYFMTKFFAVFCLSFPVFLCLYLCITVVIHMDQKKVVKKIDRVNKTINSTYCEDYSGRKGGHGREKEKIQNVQDDT